MAGASAVSDAGLLAVPLLLLYEISIWLVRGMEKRKAAAEAAEDAADKAPGNDIKPAD